MFYINPRLENKITSFFINLICIFYLSLDKQTDLICICYLSLHNLTDIIPHSSHFSQQPPPKNKNIITTRKFSNYTKSYKSDINTHYFIKQIIQKPQNIYIYINKHVCVCFCVCIYTIVMDLKTLRSQGESRIHLFCYFIFLWPSLFSLLFYSL